MLFVFRGFYSAPVVSASVAVVDVNFAAWLVVVVVVVVDVVVVEVVIYIIVAVVVVYHRWYMQT